MKVPFFRADLDGRELEYIREVLESGWLTSGKRVHEFERLFADATGAAHAIAVNSCTAALHLACEAAGVGPGSEVLVPSLTFTATAEVVEYLGGAVRLVDVDPTTGLLTPDLLEEALDEHSSISCVMPVHFGGAACQMLEDDGAPGIVEICQSRGISIVEDAAHAFPANYDHDKPVGSPIGTTACCFSFYANKTITTGEGGMVTTNDDAVADRMRRMRLHGIDRSAWDRHTRVGAAWEYDVIAAGFKYNLTDIAAAIGIAQLERAREFRDARARLVDAYRERLGRIEALRFPPAECDGDHHAWHLFVIRVDPASGIERNRLIEEINARGIGTSVHYKPLHRMTHWSKNAMQEPAGYRNADEWFDHCISLPLFPSMTDGEFEAVCLAVENAASICLDGASCSRNS
ncbi:MAG: aminotransferase [Planctomycetaceae bacterium]|nr:aminotransferase [Planctomycetaceae bacterium]